jgi:hypothetical protein
VRASICSSVDGLNAMGDYLSSFLGGLKMAKTGKAYLITPRMRREIYWISHPMLRLLLTGILPCIVWCLPAYLIIGHFADLHGFYGESRLRVYHALDIAFFPGLGWLVWRVMKIFEI